MIKLISLILILAILSPPVFGLVRRDTPLRPRTDRHNNPTAMIWTREREAFFRNRGYWVKKGDPFPNTNRYHTLDMTRVADPVKATIEYIDIHSFYTDYGRQRWEHTAMSPRQWRRLTEREKRNIIQLMYNKENLSKNKIFASTFFDTPKPKSSAGTPTAASGRIRTTPTIPIRKIPAIKAEKIRRKKPVIKTVFYKTFTDQDIDEQGNIKCFTWTDNFRAGDRIEVTARLPGYAKEIYIYRGPNRTPKWKTTRNGRFSGIIEYVPKGKAYYIWLEKGKGIEAKVVITRLS